MTRTHRATVAAIVTSLSMLAASAFAQIAEGGKCVSPACLATADDSQPVVYLLAGMVATGPKTQGGPVVIPGLRARRMLFRVQNWPAACPAHSLKFESNERVTEGAPSVWSEITTQTMGPGLTDVSEIYTTKPVGPALRVTFLDVTDANCNNQGGISVTGRAVD